MNIAVVFAGEFAQTFPVTDPVIMGSPQWIALNFCQGEETDIIQQYDQVMSTYLEGFKSVTKSQILTSTQAVTIINDLLRTIVIEYMKTYKQGYDAAQPNGNHQHYRNNIKTALWYFSQYCKFEFKADEGKIGITFTKLDSIDLRKPTIKFTDSLGTLIRNAVAGGSREEAFVSAITTQAKAVGDTTFSPVGFYVKFATGLNGESFASQKRIARIMGMEESTDEQKATYNNQNVAFVTHIDLMKSVMRINQSNQYAVLNKPLIDVLTHSVKKYPMHSSQSLTKFFDKMSNTLRYDYLYIKTTQNTNTWNNHGNKTNIFDIIPIQNSSTEITNEHSHDTRIYQVKDSNASGFMLQIVDEHDEPIEFRDDFVMNIAIFFTPN